MPSRELVDWLALVKIFFVWIFLVFVNTESTVVF
jgi:hypothetical protein